jgi:hypothetical protein
MIVIQLTISMKSPNMEPTEGTFVHYILPGCKAVAFSNNGIGAKVQTHTMTEVFHLIPTKVSRETEREEGF